MLSIPYFPNQVELRNKKIIKINFESYHDEYGASLPRGNILLKGISANPIHIPN